MRADSNNLESRIGKTALPGAGEGDWVISGFRIANRGRHRPRGPSGPGGVTFDRKKHQLGVNFRILGERGWEAKFQVAPSTFRGAP